MKPILHCLFSIVVLCSFSMAFTSCGNSSDQAPVNTIDTITAGTPRKGMIWDRKNIVDIPLTLDENNMKGHIRSVAYSVYKLNQKNGDTLKELEVTGQNLYNENGYLTEQNEYHADGSRKWKLQYNYIDKYQSKEWHFHFFDRNDEYTTTFKYDENGNNIEKTITNTYADRSEIALLRYDNMGNEVQEITLSANGIMKRATISNYDELGDQTMYVNLSTEGDTTFQLTATYDENGYKTGGSVYISGSAVTNWTQKNDQKGRMIEKQEFDAKGNFIRKTIQTYDTAGNILKTITFKADETIDQSTPSNFYEYQYDHRGNIIRSVKYNLKSGSPVPIQLKEYSYIYY